MCKRYKRKIILKFNLATKVWLGYRHELYLFKNIIFIQNAKQPVKCTSSPNYCTFKNLKTTFKISSIIYYVLQDWKYGTILSVWNVQYFWSDMNKLCHIKRLAKGNIQWIPFVINNSDLLTFLYRKAYGNQPYSFSIRSTLC